LSTVLDKPLEADADVLIAEARRRTGLDDYGPNRFDVALHSQISDLVRQDNMTEQALRGHLEGAVRNLSMVLRMQDFFTRHPEIEDQPIVAPVVIIGLQRTGTSKLFWNIAADPQWNVLYTWQALDPIPPAGWEPGMPDGRLEAAKIWCEQQAFMASARALWRHALVLAVVSPFGYILVLYAARLAPLSHVAPAREVSMLFAALLGGRLLGEADRGLRLIGAACLAFGVVALASG